MRLFCLLRRNCLNDKLRDKLPKTFRTDVNKTRKRASSGLILGRKIMIELKGQVVHKRKLSKKLIFFDIEQINEDKKCDEDRITVVLKSWICENETFVKATQGHLKIHVGDQV